MFSSNLGNLCCQGQLPALAMSPPSGAGKTRQQIIAKFLIPDPPFLPGVHQGSQPGRDPWDLPETLLKDEHSPACLDDKA